MKDKPKTLLFSSHPNADGRDKVANLLKGIGYNVYDIFSKESILEAPIEQSSLLISDRTQFIFPDDFISKCNFLRLNTHPSLLPYHKGSHPVFWASILNHKLGISIHSIDSGIDTGSIFYQEEVAYNSDQTIKEIHSNCRRSILNGIRKIASDSFANKTIEPISVQPPIALGHHLKKDAIKLVDLLPNKWDTPLGMARLQLEEILKHIHYPNV